MSQMPPIKVTNTPPFYLIFMQYYKTKNKKDGL